MALTKITGEGLGSLGTGNLTHGSDSGDTRFSLNSANQYTLVLKNAGNIAGQIGGSGSDVLRFSNAAGATIMEMNAGQITKPLQPAFLARPSARQANLAINTTHTVVFDTEIFDQNADFSSNTFTAPVTGKYQLNVHLLIQEMDADTDFYYINLKTSNRIYDQYWDNNDKAGDNGNGEGRSVVVLADMDAGDTAYLEINVPNSGAAQMDVETASAFSGYLVA